MKIDEGEWRYKMVDKTDEGREGRWSYLMVNDGRWKWMWVDEDSSWRRMRINESSWRTMKKIKGEGR